ncbi:MAG: peptidylprolyl isomerase [Bacteroidota bacterium]
MKKFLSLILLLLLAASTHLLAQKKSKKDYVVTISTEFGDMALVLSDKTPKHKANFLKLAQEGFYNDLLFHRIIQDFMIQGGDPESKKVQAGAHLGSGDVGYTIPAEFDTSLIHRKGALAAARNNNPTKASSGCQFYIVHAQPVSAGQLRQIEAQSRVRYSPEQKKIYETVGGVPHLDQNYTVFGQLIKGFEVLDKIAIQPKDEYDRPKKDIKMTVTVQNMRKKKITKTYGYLFN